jgi:hypothetical protein
MGRNYYKKTCICECGCDYGSSCGRMITYLLIFNRVNDVYSLYVKDGDESYKLLRSFEENELQTLVAVLTATERIELITDEDLKL